MRAALRSAPISPSKCCTAPSAHSLRVLPQVSSTKSFYSVSLQSLCNLSIERSNRQLILRSNNLLHLQHTSSDHGTRIHATTHSGLCLYTRPPSASPLFARASRPQVHILQGFAFKSSPLACDRVRAGLYTGGIPLSVRLSDFRGRKCIR